MNTKKVPQIFVSSGAAKWNDPKNFPWTIGWQPNYQVEARIYAAYILKNFPGKTIGDAVQGRELGVVRTADVRRKEQLSRRQRHPSPLWGGQSHMTNFSRWSWLRTISQRVVPANAGTHMWTAPVPQEFF